MKRPYVICHILSSLDGKINGPFMGMEATGLLARAYGEARENMQADAWMYGTATTKEFTSFRKPALRQDAPVWEGDFVAVSDADPYYVSVDTEGEIGWESGTFRNKGRAPAHVIEVLTEATSSAYKAYLRETGVSYIVAGKDRLDCQMAMEKLYRLFHIEKLLICGGGMVDWSFLRAGMVDELSLFLAPISDGSQGTASLFSRMPGEENGQPVEFGLNDMENVGEAGLRLKYLAKNARKS